MGWQAGQNLLFFPPSGGILEVGLQKYLGGNRHEEHKTGNTGSSPLFPHGLE